MARVPFQMLLFFALLANPLCVSAAPEPENTSPFDLKAALEKLDSTCASVSSIAHDIRFHTRICMLAVVFFGVREGCGNQRAPGPRDGQWIRGIKEMKDDGLLGGEKAFITVEGTPELNHEIEFTDGEGLVTKITVAELSAWERYGFEWKIRLSVDAAERQFTKGYWNRKVKFRVGSPLSREFTKTLKRDFAKTTWWGTTEIEWKE